MSDGVGIVEPKTLELELPENGYRLESGGVLKQISVRYETCGAPMRADNVVFICHALTGDAHVAGIRPGEEKPSGWWEGMIGPGRAVDTNRFHVICANVLGGCSGTTGPMSINPATGKPYGSSFPQYTFSDAVDIYRLLLKQLGTVFHVAQPKLHLLIFLLEQLILLLQMLQFLHPILHIRCASLLGITFPDSF